MSDIIDAYAALDDAIQSGNTENANILAEHIAKLELAQSPSYDPRQPTVKTVKAVPKPQEDLSTSPEWDAARGAYGIAETGANILTGLGASALGGIRGMGELITSGDLNKASDLVTQSQKDNTYQPRTDVGKGLTHAISVPFEKASEGWKGIGSIAGKALGNEDLGETIGNMVVPVVGTLAGRPSPATVGNVIGGSGRALSSVSGGLGGGARALAQHTIGGITGAGAEAPKVIFDAAKQSALDGMKSLSEQNLRKEVPITDMLESAKSAVQDLRSARGAEYRQGMQGIKSDETVIPFEPIAKAMDDALAIKRYKGRSLEKSTLDVQKAMLDEVESWKAEEPSQYHTAEGLDALKQSLGDIRDNTVVGTPSRLVADRVYNSVKNEIIKQAPEYAKVMKDYWEASDQIKDLERTFSLGDKAAKDTAIRKLQSLMRNNVSTNYGYRTTLADKLGPEVSQASAGQIMNSWWPRGLHSMLPGMSGAGGVGAALASHSLAPLATIPLSVISSPRIMGEAFNAAGKAAGYGQKGLNALSDASGKYLPETSTSVKSSALNMLANKPYTDETQDR